jgi:hypothetical protein
LISEEKTFDGGVGAEKEEDRVLDVPPRCFQKQMKMTVN